MVYDGTGNIAIFYPSDYGFATSGRADDNGNYSFDRSTCLTSTLTSWSLKTGCFLNDWLYDSGGDQLILSPYISGTRASSNLTEIYALYYYMNYVTACIKNDIRPTIYLKSSIGITVGSGTKSDPYTLGDTGSSSTKEGCRMKVLW